MLGFSNTGAKGFNSSSNTFSDSNVEGGGRSSGFAKKKSYFPPACTLPSPVSSMLANSWVDNSRSFSILTTAAHSVFLRKAWGLLYLARVMLGLYLTLPMAVQLYSFCSLPCSENEMVRDLQSRLRMRIDSNHGVPRIISCLMGATKQVNGTL